MKNENGVALHTLLLIIVVIIIIATIIVKYGMKMIEQSKIQDLRTNMLLIQADAKKDLEEVCFQTVNLNENKEEDLTKINQIKEENLKGTIVQQSDIQKYIPEEVEINENCYYLDENILNQIGVKDSNPEKYGYFIVKYDFKNIGVEVINKHGYEGKYTLTELLDE